MNQKRQQIPIPKKNVLFLFIFSALLGVMIISQAYFIVAIIDSIFLKGVSFSTVLPMLGLLLLIMAGRVLFQYVNRRIGVQMAADVKQAFRRSLFHTAARSSFHSSFTSQSGKKVSTVTDVVDETDSYYSQYIPQIIQTSLIPFLLLLVVFTQHVHSGLILLITAPFIPIFMVIVGLQTKKKSEEQLDQLSAFSGSFLDALQGLTTLKLYGQTERQKKKMETSSLRFRDATMEILKIAFTNSFMLEVITMLGIGIVALELAIELVIYESLSFFTAFFILILVPEFYTSLKELGTAFHNGRSSLGAVKKIEEERTEEVSMWGKETLSIMDRPPLIETENISFTYGEKRFSLEHMNIHIPPYQQVAIVGRSGSGKSTLLHLLAGLIVPTEGQVKVEGRRLLDYEENEWFRHLSYISQHPYIFSGTIAENIVIGTDREVTKKDIEEAAERSGFAEVVRDLPKGYETAVGEGGRGLSGGEMQRLALARAFLKRPSVIMFDEPTNGLDVKTEQILKKSMNELRKSATVITVAHRLHTVQEADKILFLDHGRLIAAGIHEELLNRVEGYREMVLIERGGANG
ncbi:thiol reductant ABC exporter subunit CydD [Alteribacillus iranensis]|uniref:ATP-binding cassette, subfamily C, CydD n=1 Tax=Alteribacillus iranensis TaxID=930128 RepID=A0A1I2EWW4_9BACI|nr:thiol reductant ABC exporter subunit CydD [Alteribacillus iranensis]SFE97097.1 ATP-binding cassette, subfamily C, CydD [Alteribacillus iranensis]